MISRGEGRAVALSMVLRNHNPAWQLQRVSRQKRKFANRPHCGRCASGPASNFPYGRLAMQTRIYLYAAGVIVTVNVLCSAPDLLDRLAEQRSIATPLLWVITSFIAGFCIDRMQKANRRSKESMSEGGS